MNKAQTNKKRVCIVVYDISDMGGTNQVASSLAAELVKKYDLYVLSIRKESCRIGISLWERGQENTNDRIIKRQSETTGK